MTHSIECYEQFRWNEQFRSVSWLAFLFISDCAAGYVIREAKGGLLIQKEKGLR